MKVALQYLLLHICLLLIVSPAMGQDERTFQAYQKQAQRYESQKNYKQAIDAYRKALLYASPENRKQIDQVIDHLEESLQEQLLINQGLADEAQRRIQKLGSLTNRNRFKNDLSKLQQQDDATKNDFQDLIRQVDEAKQAEANINEVATAPTSSPARRPAPVARMPKPNAGGPPPKTITVSNPGETPKSNPDAKATKSAGALRNAGAKPKQSN